MEKKRDKFIPVTYAEARSEIERLVEHFARNLDAYKQSAATIPADKYEPSVRLYQRQIEITDRQIDALVLARQQAGTSCMG